MKKTKTLTKKKIASLLKTIKSFLDSENSEKDQNQMLLEKISETINSVLLPKEMKPYSTYIDRSKRENYIAPTIKKENKVVKEIKNNKGTYVKSLSDFEQQN